MNSFADGATVAAIGKETVKVRWPQPLRGEAMNRRGLFAVIAGALAWVGVRPAAARPVYPGILGDRLPSLDAVRDLLLPGLWGISGELSPQLQYPGLQLNIHIENDHLLVVGYYAANSRMLGYAITKDALMTGRYKAEFGPSTRALCRVLTQALPPYPDDDKPSSEELRKYGFMRP